MADQQGPVKHHPTHKMVDLQMADLQRYAAARR